MRLKTIIICILIFGFYSDTECQNWMPWGNGSDCAIYPRFFVDTNNNIFFASGKFVSGSGDTIYGIARWNGIGWDSVGFGVNGSGGMLIYKNKLCASSGLFVSSWNGTSWDTLGSLFGNDIKDIVLYNNELYAVGFIGNRIAKWNDTVWSYIPTPTALTDARVAFTYSNELYVGGSWDADSVRMGVMRWDGNIWKSLGNGILPSNGICGGSSDGVWDLAIYWNILYVAGCFYNNPGHENPGNCIAGWDGSNWFDAGGGTNAYIHKMVIYNDELYACGWFTTAGGVPAADIAKWDGTQWCSLGSTFYGRIYDMTVFNGELIIGGTFTYIDGYPIHYIAKWTGGSYVDTCGNTAGIEQELIIESEFTVYPNPASNIITVEFDLPAVQDATIEIRNVLGQIVMTDNYEALPVGRNNIILDIGDIPTGLYFVVLQLGDLRFSGKFVKE